MFSLESPHRGYSNEFTQYTISRYEKENQPKLSQICSYEIFSNVPKNEFETAMVNEPSVFGPLKFYCTHITVQALGLDCNMLIEFFINFYYYYSRLL